MGKLILFLLIAAGIYWWLRRPRPTLKQGSSSGLSDAEEMVRCHHCGLHVPTRESVAADGHHYCSEEHRKLDAGGTHD